MKIAEFKINEANKIGLQIIPMLTGVILGVEIEFCAIPQGTSVEISGRPGGITIGFLCKGTASFSQANQQQTFTEKAMFVGLVGRSLNIHAVDDSEVLVIKKFLTAAEIEEMHTYGNELPMICLYTDAIQYRDPFKSEKTISRALLPQRIIPGFALGSVETYGDDLIGQHEHPLLDQFFFSFHENNMTLLIDDFIYPMGPDTLLHIPLGSNHGVSVKGKECAHYLWIDAILCKEGDSYLDEVHKKTGTMRSF